MGLDPALWTPTTAQPTERLDALRQGAPLTGDDVVGLFAAYVDGCESAGTPPTLVDLGEWLAAAGNYSTCAPADVIW